MLTPHPLITLFVAQGVPLDTVVLLLLFPLIVTLVAIFRQVIGLKAFGIYTPSIIIFAFLATGIKYGAALYITVIVVGMLMRFVLKKFRLLYLPRVALTLTIVAIAILGALVIGGSFQRTGLAAVSIFPLLIMITLVEKFVAVQIEKGTRTALFLAGETFLIAICGYVLGHWTWLINIVITAPWVVLLAIPFNIFLGKWTGLRISEYFRFRDVIRRLQ